MSAPDQPFGSLRVILLDQPVEIRPPGDGSSGVVGDTPQIHVELIGAAVEHPLKPEIGRGSASLGAFA